ncbi:hypothetical protein CTEN210_13342 [Chaetoceros tenuissimus]|uniref:HSF-type DNA-binding domain-containing protein n=1 Tax=Chaetoceros tenuissimus TaxID=426638 RepID=A0AAD3HB54_9STRA|nr:hypothetical protein CTEN210_13342 [Chaetoceros tenuissimus]
MISSTVALNTHIELLSITKKLNFPAKPFFILEFIDLYAPHLKSIFSWKHHGRCVHISDKTAFEQNIMTLFFNSAKYDTFRRQLNIWGFTRIVKVKSPDIGCYFHEKFLRGQFDRCNTIVRSRVFEFMKMPSNQPDFEEMPIMPATVTLSIPHFAGFAKNLSSALFDHHDETSLPCLSNGRSQNTFLSKDKDANNSHVSLIQSKKRKPDFQLENNWSQQLYSRTFESAYPVQMNQESWAAALPTGSTSAYLPKLPTVSSIKDTCTEYNNTFSNQEHIRMKQKSKRVSIDHSLPISNAFVKSSTFNEAITSLKQDAIVPTMDIMPLEQSLALAQMLRNQQQVARYNLTNMTPNATISTYPSTMEIGNIQNIETEWNLGSPNQTTTTMPINDSIKSCNDVPSSTSLLSLSTLEKLSQISQELASCNSMFLSIMIASNPDMMRKMKPFLLDKKNETWSL